MNKCEVGLISSAVFVDGVFFVLLPSVKLFPPLLPPIASYLSQDVSQI